MEWIVVASAREARILEKTAGHELHQIKIIRNPLGREHNRAMTTDKPGMNRGKSFSGSGLHTLAKENSPHEDALQAFAKKFVDDLFHELEMKKVEHLTLIAEPHLLGKLKRLVKKKEFVGLDLKWVNKDLQNISIEGISDHLKKYYSSSKNANFEPSRIAEII